VIKELELRKTKPGIYSFDEKARKRARVKFPDHPFLSALSDLPKKSKMRGQLEGLRKHSETVNGTSIIGYDYEMAGTATGRFNTRKPAFHHFAKRVPKRLSLSFPKNRH
jgi:hypothetical protein